MASFFCLFKINEWLKAIKNYPLNITKTRNLCDFEYFAGVMSWPTNVMERTKSLYVFNNYLCFFNRCILPEHISRIFATRNPK